MFNLSLFWLAQPLVVSRAECTVLWGVSWSRWGKKIEAEWLFDPGTMMAASHCCHLLALHISQQFFSFDSISPNLCETPAFYVFVFVMWYLIVFIFSDKTRAQSPSVTQEFERFTGFECAWHLCLALWHPLYLDLNNELWPTIVYVFNSPSITHICQAVFTAHLHSRCSIFVCVFVLCSVWSECTVSITRNTCFELSHMLIVVNQPTWFLWFLDLYTAFCMEDKNFYLDIDGYCWIKVNRVYLTSLPGLAPISHNPSQRHWQFKQCYKVCMWRKTCYLNIYSSFENRATC